MLPFSGHRLLTVPELLSRHILKFIKEHSYVHKNVDGVMVLVLCLCAHPMIMFYI